MNILFPCIHIWDWWEGKYLIKNCSLKRASDSLTNTTTNLATTRRPLQTSRLSNRSHSLQQTLSISRYSINKRLPSNKYVWKQQQCMKHSNKRNNDERWKSKPLGTRYNGTMPPDKITVIASCSVGTVRAWVIPDVISTHTIHSPNGRSHC